MSDGEELLGKADALLSKYRSGTASTGSQSRLPDFPVLTEVVESPVDTAQLLPIEPGTFRADLVPLPSESTVDQELTQLEEELRRKVLLTIEPFVIDILGEILDTRLKGHLDPAFDRLAREIADATRSETVALVRQAISEAVQREIASLQAQVKG
jgi:hypothetical protein